MLKTSTQSIKKKSCLPGSSKVVKPDPTQIQTEPTFDRYNRPAFYMGQENLTVLDRSDKGQPVQPAKQI